MAKMHIAYWKLTENPFQNVADTRFAYLGNQYHEAMARLLFLIEQQKTGGILTGPFGVGKSMVLELVRDRLTKTGVADFVQIDAADGASVFIGRMLLRKLGYNPAEAELPQIIETLAEHFSRPQPDEQHLVLAVDEAHLILTPEAAEFLHLLANLTRRDSEGRTVSSAMTMILSGHPELLQKMAVDGALCQRLQVRWEIKPLNEDQTREYIFSRIKVAGGGIDIFDPSVFSILYQASGGLPRLINNICDIALLLAAAARVPKVTGDIMDEAVYEADATNVLDLTIKGQKDFSGQVGRLS